MGDSDTATSEPERLLLQGSGLGTTGAHRLSAQGSLANTDKIPKG